MVKAYSLNPFHFVQSDRSLIRSFQNWLLAALVTLLLILLMSQLIATEYRAPDSEQSIKVEDIQLPVLKPTVNRFEPPQKVADPQPQPMPPKARTEIDPANPAIVIAPPAPEGEKLGPVLADSGPVPIFKPAPRYPRTALRQGIEGYVVVEFSIGRAGNVLNPIVVGGYDSAGNPTDVFNRAAITAVERFKYRPQQQDGKPVVRHGVRNRIRFKLAE